MAEEARLESVYTSKAYPGFESPSLRKEERGWEPRGFVIAKRLRSKNPRLSARKKGDENQGGRYREALAQQESPSLRKEEERNKE